MPRSNKRRLTPLESMVMNAVWDAGEATVHEVRDELEPVKPMAYNTVLTVMRILREKGVLASRREGRSDVYRPLVTREQVAERSLGDLLDRFFSGSAAALVSQLVRLDSVDEEEIEAMREAVEQHRQAGDEAAAGDDP